jgi:peptidoglycan/xylan/chitin deacetylase (PgdA/CDA1 family)
MVKKLAKWALLGSGALRLAGRLRGEGAAILMYHSVVEDPAQVADVLGGIAHSRLCFQGQMELLARQFCPVSLTQLHGFLRGDLELPRRAVVITFDDGYSDNHEFAIPILDRLAIPATFYVTVDCIENRKLPWPSRLRYSFRTTHKKSWINGGAWSLETAVDREKAFLKACDEVCKLAGTVLESRLTSLEEELDTRLPHDCGRMMMTWEQVGDLHRHGHIVGSHTMTHPNMAQLAPEDAHRELTESKRRIETQLNTTIEHFAYPCPALYPSWTQQTAQWSREAGYRTAVTTHSGLVRTGQDVLLLRRVLPTKTIEGLRWNLEKAFAGMTV